MMSPLSEHQVQPIRFGTDGWRGVIAADYTFANVRKCAQATARLVEEVGGQRKGVVVGYDTRFGSEHFAAAVAEVLAGYDIKVYLCDRAVPTPVVSFGILEKGAQYGVIITASHNPAIWNGYKLRSDYGGAAGPEVIERLEGHIEESSQPGGEQSSRNTNTPLEEAIGKGLIEYYDPSPGYRTKIAQLVDLQRIEDSGLKVIFDPMYGAGIGWLPELIGGGDTEVIEINGERNPFFGGVNPEPIARNLRQLQGEVRKQGAYIGIATDGDADRLGVCDENGEFVDQLRVYSLLMLYMLETREQRGPIVKTLSTSSMLDRLGALYDVPVHETGVGFKFVAPKMLEIDAMIGGEESGGYAFRGHLPERDGILAGIFIIDLCVRLMLRPSELIKYLFSKVGPHYYDRIDSHFDAGRRHEISANLQEAPVDVVAGRRVVRFQTDDGFKYHLEDGSWLLIRFSGTEPLIRIYSESSSPEQVQEILEAGRLMVELRK